MNRRLRCAVLAGVVLLAPSLLLAHPTADTFVIVTLADEGVEVTVSGDARGLALKLEALGGSMSDHLDLRFDGQRVPLSPRDTADVPGRGGFVALSFTGAAPASARQLTFRSTAIFGTYPLLVRHGREAEVPDNRYEWLSGDERSRAYDLETIGRSTAGSVLVDAIALGFTHIVPTGLDHILFVFGLFLLTTRVRAVLIQVSAFTLAHSITLGLGAAGVVSIPAGVVEPLIALSIVYIGVENLRSTSLGRGRVAVVFAFGLLHGLGFADAVSSLGLSGTGWLATLAGFNVGVELGQLTVIAIAALVVFASGEVLRGPTRSHGVLRGPTGSYGVLRGPTGSYEVRRGPTRSGDAARYRRFIVQPASVAIAAAGMVWLVERTLS